MIFSEKYPAEDLPFPLVNSLKGYVVEYTLIWEDIIHKISRSVFLKEEEVKNVLFFEKTLVHRGVLDIFVITSEIS